MGKLRISATSWEGCIDIVITPIVSYRIQTESDLSDLLIRCSNEILTIVESRVKEKLDSEGYMITDSHRFQADKGLRWEQ